MEFCPQKVFDKDREGRPVIIDIGACTGCRICESRCPDFAITVEVLEVAG
jgi:2-oxoglutarate ferredoxin oxidoreductase subunit delta